MKKILLILSLLAIFLLPQSVYSESSASVDIKNNINSSSTSNSEVKSETNIRVETNGEVTEFHSEEPNQNIEVKSINGQSSIKVDGQEVSGEALSEETAPEPSPTDLPEEKEEESNMQNEVTKIIKDGFSVIQMIFSFLGFL